uniref:Uncharacterized protein n=1 Tax=Sphaerodactylus townsendi TaxID=933632 RepID=A0ACB8F5W0_9SAUR
MPFYESFERMLGGGTGLINPRISFEATESRRDSFSRRRRGFHQRWEQRLGDHRQQETPAGFHPIPTIRASFNSDVYLTGSTPAHDGTGHPMTGLCSGDVECSLTFTKAMVEQED